MINGKLTWTPNTNPEDAIRYAIMGALDLDPDDLPAFMNSIEEYILVKHDEAYREGFEEGVDHSEETYFNAGWNAGYNEGYHDGYSAKQYQTYQ